MILAKRYAAYFLRRLGRKKKVMGVGTLVGKLDHDQVAKTEGMVANWQCLLMMKIKFYK